MIQGLDFVIAPKYTVYQFSETGHFGCCVSKWVLHSLHQVRDHDHIPILFNKYTLGRSDKVATRAF